MQLDIYFVDAFTDNIFSGNPAAVIFTDLDDKSTMQKIAAENNLSETAFVNLSDKNLIRWFSPLKEVDLCGHATLASAYIYFNYLDKKAESICYNSDSGELIVNKKDIILIDRNYIRPLDVNTLLGNAAKARKQLSWKPKINIDQLIDEMILNEVNILANDN